MKLILLSILVFGFSYLGSAQKEVPKNMPPLKMLPKTGEGPKKIYEFPDATDYSIFDSYGNFVSKGNAQFIDCTNYKKGTYFIRFNGKTERFIIE